MRFSSFIYLVGQGLHNLRANRLMTFASMGVLTVCMLLIGAASLLGINIDHMVEYIGNPNATVVYMGGTGESEVATDEQIAAADAARSLLLNELALEFCLEHLKPSGVFVTKSFQGSGFSQYVESLKKHFKKVYTRKPAASRDTSAEVYLVARELKPAK